MEQIFFAFIFYLVFSSMALIGLPLTLRMFKNQVLAFSTAKALGLLFFGYLIWLLSSLKIINYQQKGLVLGLFILALCLGIYALWKNYKQFEIDQSFYKKIVFVEIVWILLYFGYLWVRADNATINGTERFMDMGLFTASGLTEHFPPFDPWWAGKTVNYYYYGHYLFSLIANLSKTAYVLAYNFSLGLIFSTATILTGLLAFEMSRSKILAGLSAFFVTVSGSVFYSFCKFQSQAEQACYYASSTRLYNPSYIINEIPSYSFTVGDLHAHLLALPFFILVLCMLYALWQAEKFTKIFILALCIALASIGITNPWDFVTLSILIGLLIFVKIYTTKSLEQNFFVAIKEKKAFIFKAMSIGAVSIVLMLPFLSNFQSGSPGFGFSFSFAKANNLLQNYQYPSPIKGWIGLWGGFLFIFFIWIMQYYKDFKSQFNFAVLLVFMSIILLLGVEIFFVKDIYFLANPPFFRANTVFKFGFHTWTMLSISISALASQIILIKKTKNIIPKMWYKRIVKFILLVLVVLGIFYPYNAIKQYYINDPAPKNTLNGLIYMEKRYNEDFEIIKWMQKNITTRPVVVEAAGDSYSDYGRLSVFTGSQSPINWKSHEWTWRFKLPEGVKVKPKDQVETGWGLVAGISEDVRMVYESLSLEETRTLLKKYQAEYVYVGELERQAYQNLNYQKFSEIGEKVYSFGNSTLYRIKY